MASCRGDTKASELIGSPERQTKTGLNELDSAVAMSERKIALCNQVVEDLLAIQRLVEDKGLHNALINQQKNQDDFSV